MLEQFCLPHRRLVGKALALLQQTAIFVLQAILLQTDVYNELLLLFAGCCTLLQLASKPREFALEIVDSCEGLLNVLLLESLLLLLTFLQLFDFIAELLKDGLLSLDGILVDSHFLLQCQSYVDVECVLFVKLFCLRLEFLMLFGDDRQRLHTFL